VAPVGPHDHPGLLGDGAAVAVVAADRGEPPSEATTSVTVNPSPVIQATVRAARPAAMLRPSRR
jgi:hypothetical protein